MFQILGSFHPQNHVGFRNPVSGPLAQLRRALQALYLATLGGASALGLAEHLGSFEEQKRFDAVLLRRSCEGRPPVWTAESKEDLLLKIITLGDDRNSWFHERRFFEMWFLMIFLGFPFGFFWLFFFNLFRMMVRKNHIFFRVPPRHRGSSY